MELGIKIVPCWMAIGLFFCMCMVSSYPSFMYPNVIPSSRQSMLAKDNYVSFPEVEKECHNVISTASRLRRDRNRVDLIRNELSFYYGDWEQDSGGSKPLVPIPFRNSSARLFQLASFTVSDVEEDRRSPSIVKVFGSMTMQITDGKYHFDYGNYSSMNRFSTDNSPQFQFTTDFSSLTIFFEGIYSEAEANGGERVLCLLGETSVPTPLPDSSHPREPQGAWRTRRNQFAFLQDDRILMNLRYPKSLNLTSRVIHGEMTSLHNQTDARYFGKIRISSQLGSYSTYQFEAEDLFSKACTPYPYRDKMFSDQITVYNPSQVCGSLNQFAFGAFLIFPNWKCNSSRENCNELGPFNSSLVVGRNNGTGGVFGRSTTLLIQDVRCEEQPTQGNATSTKFSAVFRAITEPIEVHRSSLDGMTLAAEGTWTADGSQLCMVGCLGSDGKRCDARVLMYFPASFSISQRYVMIGSISSAKFDGVDSYYPLSFGKRVSAWDLQSLDAAANISYKYTKFEKAMVFLENKEPDFTALLKKSLLRFPTMEDGFGGFSRLANDLSFNSRIFSNSWSDARIGMETFTIGPFINYYRGMYTVEPASFGVEEHMPAKTASTEEALLLNVSATLTISEFNKNQFSNISELFLEGVYNPVDGKMYMIACRDARPSWNLSDIYDLEDGMDCSIDVKIEYPPVTARWLVTEYVKITILSHRTEDDPIYFKKFELRTFPITYSSQREDMLSRENVEGVLQILTLSISVACLFSQLFSIRKDSSTVPYISIVMLGVLALGYSIPLIGGAGSLFFGRKSKSRRTFVNFQNYQSSHFIDYFVKILFLAAFLLTLRLVQKVWKSRNRLSSGVPSGSKLVPNEKWVFFACLCIHVVGFLAVINVNGVSKLNNTTGMYLDAAGNTSLAYPVLDIIDIRRSRQWGVELEEYVGMVQDFFLLPQVIGNFLWQLDGQPLRKTYYIGIAILRILPHVYDYARAPTSYPYEQAMPENAEFVNPDLDFYSKFGDIAIPIVASLLAAVVFCQQRWKCQKLYQLLGLERFRVLFLRQRAYERLPTVHEAELVAINGIADRSRF